MKVAVVITVFALSASLAGCVGPIVRPSLSPSKPKGDALLVLPGFGYGRGGQKALRSLAPLLASEGVDLYVPTYLTRSGLAESRAKLERFIRDNRLDRYERVHVFAFIAGAWTLNPLVERRGLPNLASVIYDRSPFQERAPRIAAAELRLLTWVRYGSTVFDVARTPYVPLTTPGVKVALMVESTPTSFIRRYEKPAREYGPFRFDCDSFLQRYDDCLYLPMNHDELYVRFAEVWPELLTFIRTGRFSSTADRTPPAADSARRDRNDAQTDGQGRFRSRAPIATRPGHERRRLGKGVCSPARARRRSTEFGIRRGCGIRRGGVRRLLPRAGCPF